MVFTLVSMTTFFSVGDTESMLISHMVLHVGWCYFPQASYDELMLIQEVTHMCFKMMSSFIDHVLLLMYSSSLNSRFSLVITYHENFCFNMIVIFYA